jgi:Uma2 family endonuclease
MPVATVDYLAAIARLPDGAALRMDAVSWQEYEQLLADLGEGYAVRIFYDDGRMEIMSPAYTHERSKGIINRLVMALSDELDIDVESAGSTTLKAEMKEKGAEPDDSFYVQNAPLMIGKEGEIHLETGPPPDLVVEVDRSSSSLNRFPIYAGLGVPEVWRISKGQVHIWWLMGDHYEASPTSRAFPFLPAQTLSEFLAEGLAEGKRKAAQAFRAWVREHHQTK